MTPRTPRFQRRNYGSGHGYTLDGHKIPGVTTIIGKTLDKPALVGWAANTTARYAVENWAHLSAVDPIARYEELSRARFNTVKKAADQGTRIHAMAEQIALGREVEVPEEISLQVEAAARFLDRWGLETVAVEFPVCHTGYRYAGTGDLLVRSDRFGLSLMDWKTGRGVYDDFALQQAAYRYSDVMLAETPQTGPRGGRRPSLWAEEPMPQVDSVLIAHVTGDTVDLHPVHADETVFDVFLYLLEVYEAWIRRTGWEFRDADTYAPTIGAAIYPEQDLTREGFPNE